MTTILYVLICSNVEALLMKVTLKIQLLLRVSFIKLGKNVMFTCK